MTPQLNDLVAAVKYYNEREVSEWYPFKLVNAARAFVDSLEKGEASETEKGVFPKCKASWFTGHSEVKLLKISPPNQGWFCPNCNTVYDTATPEPWPVEPKPEAAADKEAEGKEARGLTEDGERVPPIEGDLPCDDYDDSGPGAGVESDGFSQCAQCGHRKTDHSEEAVEHFDLRAQVAQLTKERDEARDNVHCHQISLASRDNENNQLRTDLAAARKELAEARESIAYNRARAAALKKVILGAEASAPVALIQRRAIRELAELAEPLVDAPATEPAKPVEKSSS